MRFFDCFLTFLSFCPRQTYNILKFCRINTFAQIILLFDLPSSDSSDIQNKKQLYYLSPINLYNNTNHNSQAVYNIKEDGSANLGKSITESSTVGNLFPFEGDHILYGRWGHGIRFSSTLNENNLENHKKYVE